MKQVNFLEMEEGKEYKTIWQDDVIYKKINGVLYEKFNTEDFETTFLSFNTAMKPIFEEIPWTPKLGDRFYFPSFLTKSGCDWWNWNNRESDERIQKIVGCYRTPKEARAKARELGWIE